MHSTTVEFDSEKSTNRPGGPALSQERNIKSSLPGPHSLEWGRRKRQAVSSAVATTMSIYAAAGNGGVLVDVDGNSFIDLGSGIAVTTIGNAHSAVVDAVVAQTASFTHTCFMVTPYSSYVQVAEQLNVLTPGDFEKRTALFNSGAEAVENAVKIARTFTGRNAIVAFDHAYHGRTNLTMALTAKSHPYKNGFGPFASEIYRAPLSYPFRDGLSGLEAANRAIDQIEKQVGVGTLAAIIIEPIQGEGGFIVPAEGFLPTLVEWARANGVLFIADEVQTGFARTGAMFACEHEQIVPDLIVTAKGIAAGLPLSAVTGRADVMDSPSSGGLGGTFGGNPIACAAALASLEVIHEEGLVERARNVGDRIMAQLTKLQETDDRIADVRGRGAMIAMELVISGTTEPDPLLARAVAGYAHENGVILLTCGTHGNVIRLLPSLAINDELLDEALGVIANALAIVSGSIAPRN